MASTFGAALRNLLPPPSDVDRAACQAATDSHEAPTAALDTPVEARCARLHRYSVEADAALRKWQLVLDNIVSHPAEPKYRALRYTSPIFAALAGPGRPAVDRSTGHVRTTSPPAAPSREEAVARVAGVLCDTLDFVGAARDPNVIELPFSLFADNDDGGSVAVARRAEQARQRAAVEDALVAVLDLRALHQQQAAALHDAVERTRLLRERRVVAEQRVTERDTLAGRLADAVSGVSASARAAAKRAVADVKADCLGALASSFERRQAVDHARELLRWLARTAAAHSDESPDDNAEAGTSVWQCPAASLSTVKVLQWIAAACARNGLPVALDVRRAVDVRADAVSPSDTSATVLCDAGVLQNALRSGQSSSPSQHESNSVAFAVALADELDAFAGELWAAEAADAKRVRRTTQQANQGGTRGASPAAQEAAAAQRERDAVAATVIGDIAAVLEEEWHLDGAIGYRAPHRAEAKRLHAAYSAGDVSLAELHDMLEAHTKRFHQKRDAARAQRKPAFSGADSA